MSGGAGNRRFVLWLALAAIGVVGILAVGRNDGRGGPLDPDGTSPLGAKALVLLLESFGAEVDVVAVPGADHEVSIMLADQLGENGVTTMDDWVSSGGILVVADLDSGYAGRAVTAGAGDPGLCTLDALAGVGAIAGPLISIEIDPGDASCFGDRTAAVVVARSVDAGTVVTVGAAGALVNESLADADNAGLAVALLAPRPGTRVAFVHGALVGAGDRSLGDLIDEGLKWGFLQLGIAFAVFALAKGRRLGQPVEEDLPVRIAGSELTSAVGNLLERTHRPADTGRRLQQGLQHDLVRRLGLPVTASVQMVADTAAARSPVEADRVVEVLTRTVDDDAALVAVARHVADLREEIVTGRTWLATSAPHLQEEPDG